MKIFSPQIVQRRHSQSPTPRAVIQVTLILVASLAGGGALLAQPKAVAPNTIFDFGDIERGRVVTHDFEIKNEGDATLEITRVRTTCACAVTEHDAVIEPGQTGRLKVELNTELLNGNSRAQAIVLTNDANNPKLTLTVKVNSVTMLGVDPGFFRYRVHQKFPGDGRVSQTVWAIDGGEFAVTAVESDNPHFTFDFEEAADDERRPNTQGSQWRVNAYLSNNAPIGPITGYVKIMTNHPKQQIASIPMSGFVRPVFAVTPQVIDFEEIEVADEPRTSNIHVKQFADEPVEVERVEITVPGMTAEARTDDRNPGHVFWLDVAVTPEMAEGSFSGTVKVYTNSAYQPVLEVPVMGNLTIRQSAD